jgi:hypothetical protein
VHRLLDRVSFPGTRWLEPCAGKGAIIRAVRDYPLTVTRWTAYERRAECVPALQGLGEVEIIHGAFDQYDRRRVWDTAITNPPYSCALPILERLLHAAHVVVALMRLNFIAGEERAAFMRESRPSVYVLPNRPSFDGQGTDATDYAWFVWGFEERGTLEVLDSTPAVVRTAGGQPPDVAQLALLPPEILRRRPCARGR